MKQLILGRGEVGSSLHEILKCDAIDIDETRKEGDYKILHVCFSFSKNFVKYVKEYITQYNPKIVIIHSTVPVGTTEECGEEICVHSPIRGIHPNLKEGIKVFIKYFGGKKAKEASKIFEKEWIEVKVCKSSRDTEAGKLWSTTAYGLNIILQKEIKKYCDENGLDYKIVYEDFTETYNNGYATLLMPEVMRPILKHMEGEIGGHCIISNCKLLKGPIPKLILKQNNKFKRTKKEKK